MRKSFSKIRHIQEANMKLEKRTIHEQTPAAAAQPTTQTPPTPAMAPQSQPTPASAMPPQNQPTMNQSMQTPEGQKFAQFIIALQNGMLKATPNKQGAEQIIAYATTVKNQLFPQV